MSFLFSKAYLRKSIDLGSGRGVASVPRGVTVEALVLADIGEA